MASELRPIVKKLVSQIDKALTSLKTSLEGVAMAERKLKFAQALGDMDLDEAEELVAVSMPTVLMGRRVSE